MRFFLGILSVVIGLHANAQNYQTEINEQVWIPFLNASSEFDGEKFMSLQSKDLIRVSLDRKVIEDYSQYESGIVPNFKRIRGERKVSRETEMRFLERIASANEAFESGYFKSTTTRANGEQVVRYSLFYITLKKENSEWKILVDADTNINNGITEEMYQSAAPM
jgi:hypothetical protein